MTIEQFADFVNGFSGERPQHLRIGQWAYNLLSDSFPEIAYEINGTDCDPFYDDARVPAFLNRVLDFVEVKK